MIRALPEKPDVQNLKKQAKRLLKAFSNHADTHARDEATAFIVQWHPKPARFTGLRDAQLAIARSYGQQDWLSLKNAVEQARINALSVAEKATIFMQLGCVQYRGNDQAVFYDRARRILHQDPELANFDLYAAIVAGNLEAMLTRLNQQPELALRPGGPFNWPPILYATYARVGRENQRDDLLGIVEALIQRGANPNTVMVRNDIYRFTALTGAMGEGEAGVENQPPHPCAREVATCLLEAGADPNDGQGLYNTMFTDSSSSWLRLLVRNGLNASHRINWSSEEDAPTCFDFLLGHAAKNGLLERASELIQLGADVNFVDGYEHRPVHTLARTKGHDAVAELLAANGAIPESLSASDHARIAIAAADWESLQQLLSKHGEFLQESELLHHALACGQENLVWRMLELGFDINGTDAGGMTIMHTLAWHNQVEAVDRLLRLGADEKIRSRHYDSTPLGHAAYNQSMEVVALLADASDDIFDAVRCARPERVAMLLNQEPDALQQQTPAGNSLLHLVGAWLDDAADEMSCAAIMDDLLARGLDINLRNRAGETPLDLAIARGNDESQALLEARGASRSR